MAGARDRQHLMCTDNVQPLLVPVHAHALVVFLLFVIVEKVIENQSQDSISRVSLLLAQYLGNCEQREQPLL
jgi:hypothetical protein